MTRVRAMVEKKFGKLYDALCVAVAILVKDGDRVAQTMT
jgi:hypothetical protein